MKDLSEIKQEASAVGLKFVGPYKGIMKRTEYICKIHGTVDLVPNRVQQGAGCKFCGRQKQYAARRLSINRVMSDAERVGLAYVTGFTSTTKKAVYRCAVHGELQMYPTVPARGGGCQQCSVTRSASKLRKTPEHFSEKAEAVGLIYIGRVSEVRDRAMYRCPIHGIIEMRPSVVHRGGGCNICGGRAPKSLDALKREATAVGLEYADSYVASNAKARYQCRVHGEITMNPAVVRRGGGCRFCAKNAPKDEHALKVEAQASGLRYIGPYQSDGKKTAYECAVHGALTKRPGDVKAGKGCRKCAKYGPDAIAPAKFYVYRIDRLTEPSFIGYGITKDHETRYAAHRSKLKSLGYSAEPIATFDLESGRRALDLEQHVWDELRDVHIKTEIKGFKEEAILAGHEPRLLETISRWLSG